ncbi:hypothetical protein Areg01_76320 [Actinoplanes regularis]|nr:hypothetical protein Areg01_76320 [Actinoplanes regularis]
MVAAEPADLSFDAALLVSALQTRLAVERFQAIPRGFTKTEGAMASIHGCAEPGSSEFTAVDT